MSLRRLLEIVREALSKLVEPVVRVGSGSSGRFSSATVCGFDQLQTDRLFSPFCLLISVDFRTVGVWSGWLIWRDIVTTGCRILFFVKKILTVGSFMLMFCLSREIVVILALLF